MYTTFFDLRELPFPLANDLHFFYSTPALQQAEENIFAAFRKHTGLVLLTGEPGTGKTMLLHRIISSLESHTSIILLPFSAVTFDDILTYLCEHFAIVTPSNDPFTRVLAIQEHLQTPTEHGMHVVLCIDEAQNLRKETLDRLRLLLHLKGPNGKLFQILLVGQQQLETKLAHPDLRHIQQYITDHYCLGPLTRDAVSSFILHRLQIAGCDRTDLFTPEAIERIAYYSQHVPRSINVICDNALVTAYLAGSRTVSLGIIEDVAQNLQLNNSDEVEVRVSESTRPSVDVLSSQDTQDNPQPSRHRWLYNLVSIGAGVALAWLSSANLPSETQPRGVPLHVRPSLPITEASTSPTNEPPVPQHAKTEKLLTHQPAHLPIAEKHNQNNTYAAVSPSASFSQHSLPASSSSMPPNDQRRDTPQQGSPIIRTLAQPVVSDSTLSTSSSSKSSLIKSPPRQLQTLYYLPPSPTFPRRTYETRTAPLPRGRLPLNETLLNAVATNDVQETKRLLAARIPVDTKNKNGWTGLMIAARENYPQLVRLFLSYGANVNSINREGETALIHAADNNHPAIVQLLLERGASIDTKSNLGWTALMYAASKGHRLTVETLLNNGADPNVKDKDGRTASMYAAQQSNVSIMAEHLRDRRALRHRFGRPDETRLQLVTRQDYKIIASLLKEAEGKK